MPSDAQLLSSYVEGESEQAFTTLVQRHLPIVYSAAVRQVGGDPHRAQEVVQSVFTLLARKARRLRQHPTLIGWLYTTTHYTAAKLRRAEQRRRRAEEQAMSEESPGSDADWDQLRPVIDMMMLALKERDRTAVLLRFFADQSYSEIGSQLGLSENAARMRVDRALEAIRSALARRGIASTSAALGTLLATQAVGAVPEGLLATVATSAMATGVGGGMFVFMASTLFKATVVLGVLAVGSAGFFLHQRSTAENVALRAELSAATNALALEKAERTQSQRAAVATGTDAGIVTPLSKPPRAEGVAVGGDAAAPVNRDPEKGLTRLQDLQNVGRVTPAAAVQTILWAIASGDETLPDMLFLNKAALQTAEEVLAGLSESARKVFDTPEKLAGLYLSRMVLKNVGTVQILGVRQLDYETVEVTVLSGENGATDVSLQLTPGGWSWKVKASLMERAKREVLGKK